MQLLCSQAFIFSIIIIDYFILCFCCSALGGGARQLQEGVVHLKGFLRPDQQRELFEGIQQAAQTYTPTRARNALSNFQKIMYYNCTHRTHTTRHDTTRPTTRPTTRTHSLLHAGKSHKHLIPSSFLWLSSEACAAASDASPDHIPPSYSPDYATSFLYPELDGRLTGHVDKVSIATPETLISPPTGG